MSGVSEYQRKLQLLQEQRAKSMQRQKMAQRMPMRRGGRMERMNMSIDSTNWYWWALGAAAVGGIAYYMLFMYPQSTFGSTTPRV